MKKVLFGICALAISASAFGAIMSTGTITKGTPTSVTLPVKLEANIVNGANKLFIEGTSGDTFGDVLSLNFGDLAFGQTGKTEGRVRVFRGDTWDNNTTAFEPTKLGDNVTFSFIIDGKTVNATVDDYKHLTLENNVVSAPDVGTTVTETKLGAGIAITAINYDGAEMKASTKIEARIGAITEPIDKDQAEGKYYGSAGLVATLGQEAEAVQSPKP